jgi:hypothetical protein
LAEDPGVDVVAAVVRRPQVSSALHATEVKAEKRQYAGRRIPSTVATLLSR